jgi:RsiW-degrading membrane proteinase PrsW (M82 family)
VSRRWSFVREPWFVVLAAGSVIWVVCALVTALTHNAILVPTVILVGSFFAPVSVVTFALGRLEGGRLSAEVVFVAFLIGGTLGLVAAGLLETWLLPAGFGLWLMVGVIEELCKGVVVVVVGRAVLPRRGRDGIVLGAIVGAGFAAFESAGYALSTLLKHTGDHPIADVMSTEMTRAVYSPFAHITWTALLGGALFVTSRGPRFDLRAAAVVGTVLGTIALHAAWDASTGVAILLTEGVLEGDWSVTWPSLEQWVGEPSNRELVVWSIFYDSMLILNGFIGVSWLVRRWRRYGPAFAAVA